MRGSKRNETQNTVALPKKKTRRSNKNAAAPVSELPNHILSDILSRLPLKSIFRCKRVCKAWRNVILEPYFAELHLSRSPLSLIFYRNGNSNNNNDDNYSSSSSSSHFEIFQLHDPPISGYRIARMKFGTEIYFPHMDIQVVASCNGLVLLSNHPSKDLVIVCNPLRAQRFILPKPQRLAVPYSIIGFGFGHNPATGQYKVLRYICTYTPPISLEFDIYTLGIDDEWRSLQYTAKPPTIYGTTLVFLNGALHWIDNEKARTIFYFDIEKEQFGSFPLPSHIGDHYTDLAVVDNQLYIHSRYSYGGLQVWAMKDYGDFGSWTLELDIEASITRGIDPIRKPLKMLRDGSLLMICSSFCPRKQVIKITLAPNVQIEKITLVSYNPQTRVLTKFKHRGILLWGASVADVPCLFSPMGFEMAILKS
ncbi:F-box protein At5g18160-like isoform X2 [Rhododendron vialii]|nr:F-box protein At5g18160-like isoform X2 [Rhododendron vialii]XP_058210523.1 F-box protein At5g18160-like isoform X2 [Rhododendron vialii]